MDGPPPRLTLTPSDFPGARTSGFSATRPRALDLAEGTSTIVYAWGSAEDDNLDLAVQTIDGLHSSPSGVPGGETGEAVGSGTASWTWGLGLVSLAALLLATRRLLPVGARP